MTSYQFTFSDVFPVDDPVARWLVTLSMGFNDVLLANLKVESAETDLSATSRQGRWTPSTGRP